MSDVLILSSVEWDAVRQRHHAWAERFAAAGRRVFFVENTGFRAPGLRDAARVGRKVAGLLAPKAARRLNPVPKGVVIVNPLVLPPTGGALRAVNDAVLVPRLAAKLADLGLGPAPLAICYLPTATTLSLLDAVKPSKVVYDCVDNFAGHPSPPLDLRTTEDALLARAALVTVTSPGLFHRMNARHRRVLELHHGVSERFFLGAAPAGFSRACYFGTLWSALDYAAVAALAEAGVEVLMAGPRREAPPPLPKGVTFRDAVPHAQLPRLLEDRTVLLLPYAKTAYNEGVAPAKLYECLATGRPVLASPLPSLAALGGVLDFCPRPSDWPAAVASLPALEKDGERRAARIAMARAHSEEKAFAAFARAIEDAP